MSMKTRINGWPESEGTWRSARYGRAFQWLALTLFAVLAWVPVSGHATCNYRGGGTPIVVSAVLRGSITVGRDAALGTELYRAQATSNQLVKVECDDPASTFNYRYLSLPYPKASYSDGTWGNNVYQTNVPGIGVVGWVSGPAPDRTMPLSINRVDTCGPGADNCVVNYHNYYLSLIKIGPVSPGVVTGASLPVPEYVVGSNHLRVHLGGAIGSLNVVARTCVTPDVNVDMGAHHLGELKGMGSTTSQLVDASFKLLDCPAFFGYRNVHSNNGAITDGSLAGNRIQYQLDPTTSVVDRSNGVIALQAGGATGIGLQLLDGDSRPMTYGVSRDSRLALSQVDGSSYSVPLKARYYQTAANPTAGQANAEVTVTLFYN